MPTSERLTISRKSYYHAEIRENDKVVAKLKGRWNTSDDLQVWILEHWGERPFEYCLVRPEDTALSLRVWRYSLEGSQVIINARVPK